ncbi:DNA polymerase IV [Solitalea canadensis]|uniref:DNA polymerase IV n=1 Tax=Solitalea canadensis (strain ATCC 29591 / DSM 3403 / JCM 21819 / LMG 8368 / NBRC 15130 / NCIMB 12057 / USAM 9D) TaxID=929556 RepID=H8KQM3_SOLCM|nr:DNA polymerase IV [Solitalea canadensis]AFD06761.1 nucleotidyltransferase/DNA polymerase involved in DNA repair [Solitalea canadensis DSM 3403]
MSENKLQRKIIHIDMDAFYASVEQRDNPDYKGKPIIVGGLPQGRGGVVATASYEARRFGVRSAMPSKKAQQLCPHAIFVRPRFAAYKEVSQKIREIFHRYTDLIEPLSLDEAYLDVTHDKLEIGSAIEIAMQIKKAIKDELNLTASAGVSVNKFVAKIASDINKPDGLTFIGPSKIESFMESLAVEKFHGIGRVTAEKMKRMNLFTGADLKKLTEEQLLLHFGKPGKFYYKIVRGIDDREVQPNRVTKSVGAEDTFPYDLTDLEEMNVELDKIAKTVADRLQRYQLKGRTLTLKIKYSDFKQITRNQSFLHEINDLQTIAQTAKELLLKTSPEDKKIRLLGITLSNFNEIFTHKNTSQLELFQYDD